MPKAKTHKGIAKRIKKTGTGKLRVRAAGGGHLMSKKSGARKRRYAGDMPVHKSIAKKVQKMIPHI